jgi:hypothetical protein
MADTQNAPAPNGHAVSDLAGALDMLDANPGMLEDFLEMDSLEDDQPQDTGRKRTVDDEDQGESQSEGDEDDDLEAEEAEHAGEHSDDESEADETLKLFTVGEDGKREEVDLDDLEVPVEIDGEDQLLAMGELRKGYLRQADYTRKTQQLRERVEEGIAEEREQLTADFSERLTAIDGIVEVFGVFDKEPDLDALTAQYGGNEKAALQAMRNWQKMGQHLKKAKGLQAKAAEDKAAKDHQQLVAKVNRTVQTLRETVPEWADADRFNTESSEIRSFMLKNGLDDQDILQILQKPDHVLLMRDAMYGQQMKSKRGKVVRRRQAAPTVKRSAGTLQKPDAVSRRTAQIRKRIRSGDASKTDAVSMIEGMLPDDF